MNDNFNNAESQTPPIFIPQKAGEPVPFFGRVGGCIRGIIFDLDGTLFDTIEDIANANNAMLQKHGFPIHPISNYIEWIGNGAGHLVRMSLPSEQANDDEKSTLYIDEYKEEYKQNLIVKTAFYKGIPELLSFLNEKKIPLAVNTNKPHAQSLIIAEYFLKPYNFQLIQGQKNEVSRKPDPAGANIIAQHFGCDNSEIIYIGDSIVDVMTAKAAGMKMIAVEWGYGSSNEMRKAGCDQLVNSPLELKAFIEKRI